MARGSTMSSFAMLLVALAYVALRNSSLHVETAAVIAMLTVGSVALARATTLWLRGRRGGLLPYLGIGLGGLLVGIVGIPLEGPIATAAFTIGSLLFGFAIYAAAPKPIE